MKKNESYEEIDQLIKESLNSEEAKFYDDLDEQGFFEQMGSLFQGKMKVINIFVMIIQLAVGVGLYFSITAYIDATTTKEMITSISLAGLCIFSINMMKLYSWMQIDKNVMMREMKRLEMQIAVLAGKSK